MKKNFNLLLNRYFENGYVRLGKICSNRELLMLNKRAKDLMTGNIRYKNMFFQLDSKDGKYENIDKNSETFVGPSSRYRKIKDLEYDELFNKVIKKKTLKFFANSLIGKNVSCMRAMLLNKPNKNSSVLPFHQDVANDWKMSKKPKFTLWLSLNGASKQNGCLRALKGSHKDGILNKGHLVKVNSKFIKKRPIEYITLKKGEAIIFDNHLVHGSDKNRTKKNRLAFTVCMLDAKAKHLKTKKRYPKIFGRGSINYKTIKKIKKERIIPSKVYH